MIYTPKKFLEQVIKPSISIIGKASDQASILLLGTALKESNLTYRKQLGGPALGLFQIEPETYYDTYLNYINYRLELKKLIEGTFIPYKMDVNSLIFNDYYSCMIARIKYYRVQEKLPEVHDVEGQAKYWKKYYNTNLGKGTVEQYMEMVFKHKLLELI